ncbi:3-hydroxyacyl-CoA dehydrogenase NAD-binding domain-containing protein [Porticoccaceae bacterium]|jgi:3-hydroxyacyl-CoA dehydrogenase|nr:3-hydroxyacyl-CoA dehydrogenase [Porticoccaceae bacterium]MDA8978471.1 3-hydroxyacyl-CoA dehydrogenase NAD-binding domain-containing protein [bacterium]MBT6319822.1 3-hydroxyacyl-CoA dehydrogenase [Porticoccaceae bacterium]MBT7259087.1 3-hydroxyacyl-CoA dehydrogenase [Porticoccaceae bacterium]MDA8735276.1 3-hydroxyacyl-CoA dehydrogenase NAD-binding domain-containing protein [Porticoccaceae bacterium]
MVALTSMVDYNVEEGVAVLTLNNPPVNALSQGVRQGLKDGVEKALADDSAEAILVFCEGRTFIAGADISEFSSGPMEPNFHAVLSTMDASPKPIVAAIHGTALGGGLETALCCNYRVAVGSAKFGLPEVNLGLLPGAGGTQRLPRVVGVEKTLAMVTSGVPIGAAEAHQLGLVDQLVEGDLRAEALAFAKDKAAQGGSHPRVRDNDDKLQSAKDNPEIFAATRKMLARKTRGFLAPEYNIRCIEAAVNQPFDEGLKTEGKLFAELMSGPQSQAQQYFFFSERQAGKVPGLAEDAKELPIAKVGVIGGGLMGGGISMNFANVGVPVTIVETSQEALDRGLGTIRKNYENTARKGRLTEEAVEQRCGLIQGTLDMADLADCDLIIEAVFENMAVKKDIFTRLDAIAKQGAILASNTSALDLNEIASVTSRPESVIGLHFFSPANVMKLLEVVRGEKTSDDVIKTSMALAKRIRKVAVLVGVCPGFVGNRILFPRQIEASKLALEGAPIEQVDKVLFDFGFPMGAFQMGDLAGLDLGWDKDNSNPMDVKDRLCELGRRGQKTAAGYYDYDEKRMPTPAPVTAELFAEVAAAQGVTQGDISDEEILDRCLLPMINEGAKILEEGIAVRASDIDVTYVYGYGWPVYRGGPMHYANSMGLDKVLAKIRHYHESTGDDFWAPSPLLVSLAEQGKRFK